MSSRPQWERVGMPGTSQVQSARQSLGQASSLVPSHSSPSSVTLSPHVGRAQLVRQASGKVSEFDGPSSHASPGSTMVSPQKPQVQLSRHAPGQAASSDPSHSSVG